MRDHPMESTVERGVDPKSIAGKAPGVVAEPFPPYASKLNPADGIWGYVKYGRLPNYAPPDLEDYGQCSVGIKLMDVPGPKLLDDEQRTQDLLLVSPASFVTPNIRENA